MQQQLHQTAIPGRVSRTLAFVMALVPTAWAAPQTGPLCLIDSIPTGALGSPIATDGKRVLLEVDNLRVAVVDRFGPTWEVSDQLPIAAGNISVSCPAAIDGHRAMYSPGGFDVFVAEEGPTGWSNVQVIPLHGVVSRVVALEGDLALLDMYTLPLVEYDLTLLRRGPAGWAIAARIPYDAQNGTVEMSDGVIVVGSMSTSPSPGIDVLVVDAAGGLQRIQRITPPSAASAPWFGRYQALDGARLVVSTLEDADGNGIHGTIHEYARGASGLFQYVGRIDDPAVLQQVPGTPVFGIKLRLAGDRLMVSVLVPNTGGQLSGQVVLDRTPLGWTTTAFLDPASSGPGSFAYQALLADDALFVAADGAQGAIRRFAIGAPQGVQVCAGSAVSGPAPQLSIDGCSSASAGLLVVRAEGLTGGSLLVGLARGSVPVAPSGVSTCIRAAGSLGSFVPVGPNTAQVVVAPALVQSLPALLGDVLLIQGFQPVVTPAGGISANLTNALAIELAN